MHETFGEVGSFGPKVIPFLGFLLASEGMSDIIGPEVFLGLGGGLWYVTAGCAAFDKSFRILLPISPDCFSIDFSLIVLAALLAVFVVYLCVYMRRKRERRERERGL